ncbi:hypothetical protein GMLC_35760 [Geomonas limicola]|uniref:histidine kinase n=1 Tax=Geomonas limicola TaxID=2740186 RepID=A0A6V8NDY3_9BACT|nr:response regulator [Geomonas limicola]GFO69997.1 hypothetical protein GMLC_35760 [Geomonas limicola]
MTITTSNNQPTILLVDDSSSVRSYVAELLSGKGYLVRQASDGAACLAALELALPDVVLLDVEMPGISGLEVLQTLGPTPRLYSVILFTTQSTLEQIVAGLDLGADDYVVKPFQEVDLLARIRAALRNALHKRALAQAHQETDAALSRLKRAQRKLVEQAKIGAVGRLAAGAAHHINNPLGFVMSNLATLERYTQALDRQVDALSRELLGINPGLRGTLEELERVNHLKQIRRDLPALFDETREGNQRIALIVQQLAQLEVGLGNQRMADLDLVTVLQPLIRMLDVLAPDGTRVEWKQPHQGVTVHGSLPLLNAALIALLKNACEALGSEPGNIGVELVAHPELAEIIITDSGHGVSDEHLHSLFDPFFTTKPPESHVGLGLTIAERFISGHGGRISITSDGNGTRVSIEMPRTSSPGSSRRT